MLKVVEDMMIATVGDDTLVEPVRLKSAALRQGRGRNRRSENIAIDRVEIDCSVADRLLAERHHDETDLGIVLVGGR